MKQYLMAHDIGTSGDKATLFSTDGKLIASRIASYPTFYEEGGVAEQDAEDWWNAVQRSTRELLAQTGVAGSEVAAVSFSGQMMGCLCIDRNRRPLRRAMIWADTRAAEQAEALERKIPQQAFYHIVGHRNTASYGIQKLMWVRDHEPEIYENTWKVLNAKDYVAYCLTGNVCTDYSDANSEGCFDLSRLDWSEEILEAAGISPDKYPECRPSSYVVGNVTPEAAEKTGLSTNTKVVIGSGDGVAANVGAGSIEPGKTYLCLGTSSWITTTSDKPVFDDQMRTVTWAHMVPGLYAPNGTMQFAGGAYQWIRNNICLMEAYEAGNAGKSPYDFMNEEVSKSPVGANGILFLPYFLGERAPRWDMCATGSFVGLTARSTRADLLRSVIEGVSLNLSVILEILRQHMDIEELVILGGGAKGKPWREILASALNARLRVPALLDEAGAMGAAVNAGVGAGIYSGYGAIEQFLDFEDVQDPDPADAAKYAELREKFNDCYYALREFNRKYKGK